MTELALHARPRNLRSRSDTLSIQQGVWGVLTRLRIPTGAQPKLDRIANYTPALPVLSGLRPQVPD